MQFSTLPGRPHSPAPLPKIPSVARGRLSMRPLSKAHRVKLVRLPARKRIRALNIFCVIRCLLIHLRPVAYLQVAEKPSSYNINLDMETGIGVDALPSAIRYSVILTGTELAQLGNIPELPLVDPAWQDDRLKNIFQYYSISPDEMEKELQHYARELLQQNRLYDAWQVLLTLG